MAEVSSCPDRATLQRLMVGKVAPGEAETLEEHVRLCARCLASLPRVEASDSLVERLRGGEAIAAAFPQSQVLDDLMRQLREMSLPPAGTPIDNVAATPASEGETPVTEPGPGLIGLLAPPQGPDELGRLGPFRILKVLGAGGMGVVFHAEDLFLKRPVALKVLRPALAANALARQRFLREAQATAFIQHDHIVSTSQAGEDRGLPFLAMPLLRGESLEGRLQREGQLPVAEVLRIGRELAEGLAEAHQHALIHRDIKPSNIWLETLPGERPASASGGRVKVLDFGLVRTLEGDAHLTQTGVIAGTPHYMAPEQASGEAVDARADLFSLGCVLYRMATGQVPFPGTHTLAILRSLELREPPSPRALNPDVPPALAELILHLLAKKPGNRPASAAAVARTLAAIRPAAASADQKPPGKKRKWLMRTALAGILLALGFGVYELSTNPDDPEEKPLFARKPPVDHTKEKTPFARKPPVGRTNKKPPFAGKPPVGHTSEPKADPMAAEIAKLPGADTFDPKAERAAAEWVLKLGGLVYVVGSNNAIDQPSRLPKQPFRVHFIFLDNKKGVTDAGLELLKGRTGLRHLGLLGTGITDAGLEHLRGLTGLQVLHIGSTRVSDAGLEHLKGVTGLVRLHLDTTRITNAGLEHLKGLINLKSLGLNQTAVSDAGLKHLKGLTGLQVLHLMATRISDAGLEHLQGMTGLQQLSLTGTSVSDLGLKHLKSLTGLQILTLDGKGITNAGLEHLQRLTGLRTLALVQTAVSDAGLEHLKGLTELQVLYLSDDKAVTGPGFKHLIGLKKLKQLILNRTAVSDTGLEHLQGLTGLEWLDLAGTRISDAGLEHLKGLTKLQHLILNHTGVSDLGLKHLKGLSGLQGLHLDGTGISDAGLENLRGLTALLSLNLYNTAVSQAGIRRFKTALRKCTIMH